MTDRTNKVLEHYSAVGLTGRIQSALAAIAPESQTLTVAQLPWISFISGAYSPHPNWPAPPESSHQPECSILAAA